MPCHRLRIQTPGLPQRGQERVSESGLVDILSTKKVDQFALDAARHLGALAMQIAGSCHCGNISFKLHWEPSPSEIPARACTCSFCTKHGGVWTSCQTGSLKVAVKDSTRVSTYSFGTKTANFHVCTVCGAVPVVTSRIEGHIYAVVSVNAFEGVDPSLLNRASASFDGENEQDRLARRAKGWIPNVEFARSDV